jgi:hypothetical protein
MRKGELPIEIPRDRQGAFEPQLILQTPNPPDRIRRQDSVRQGCLPGAEQAQPEMDDALAELSRENRPTI